MPKLRRSFEIPRGPLESTSDSYDIINGAARADRLISTDQFKELLKADDLGPHTQAIRLGRDAARTFLQRMLRRGYAPRLSGRVADILDEMIHLDDGSVGDLISEARRRQGDDVPRAAWSILTVPRVGGVYAATCLLLTDGQAFQHCYRLGEGDWVELRTPFVGFEVPPHPFGPQGPRPPGDRVPVPENHEPVSNDYECEDGLPLVYLDVA